MQSLVKWKTRSDSSFCALGNACQPTIFEECLRTYALTLTTPNIKNALLARHFGRLQVLRCAFLRARKQKRQCYFWFGDTLTAAICAASDCLCN
eukprot:1449500-Amphidinium_carterae.1